MRVIETINDLKAIIKSQKTSNKSIGFVPTMGYLHEGHLSLAKQSISDNDFTIMSIFVNPTQFGPNEDFDKYPRDTERDLSLAENVGVDVVFMPSVEELYPQGYKTYVEVNDITEVLCGASRKGHFRGVTTIVSKLFNIVTPDKAYFGQKDAQQAIVIKKMVSDLNIQVEVVTCQIIRESDGLAMSSRNVYLSPEERSAAVILSQTLFWAEKEILNGQNDIALIIEKIKNKISSEELAKIDYVEALDLSTLEPIKTSNDSILIALAVWFGKTRLIDNVMIKR